MTACENLQGGSSEYQGTDESRDRIAWKPKDRTGLPDGHGKRTARLDRDSPGLKVPLFAKQARHVILVTRRCPAGRDDRVCCLGALVECRPDSFDIIGHPTEIDIDKAPASDQVEQHRPVGVVDDSVLTCIA